MSKLRIVADGGGNVLGVEEPVQPFLTADDVAALRELARDAELRGRVAEGMRQTYFNPDLWRQIGEQARRTYLNPELWQQLGERIKQTYLDPELWRKLGEALRQTYLDPELWRGASEAIARAYSSDDLRQLSAQIGTALTDELCRGASAIDTDPFAESVRQIDDEFREVGSEPADRESSLAWWLATRGLKSQIALLLAALTALDGLSQFLDSATDAGVPDQVFEATRVLLAIAAFLLLWLAQEETKSRSRAEYGQRD